CPARCVVRLPLLARRSRRARLRPHGRHPSQARLRPVRALLRSGPAPAEAPCHEAAGPQNARLPDPLRRRPARPEPGARQPWPASGDAGRPPCPRRLGPGPTRRGRRTAESARYAIGLLGVALTSLDARARRYVPLTPGRFPLPET